jgi:2-aminoethylphosphonate transport system permease protein
VLVWSRGGRASVWAVGALLLLIVYGAPIAVIALASVAGHWSGPLPSDLTLAHYTTVLSGDRAAELRASLVTAFVASLFALLVGTWAALALRALPSLPRRVLDVIFFMPSAVPSVSVGLGLLVAFSQPPILLNGTISIVLIAHFVLISAFTYGSIAAGLTRVAPDIELVAGSLGARPFYRLRRVTLPLVLPYLIGAFSLSVALSMGELGATVMVYPPGWVTMPVGIFALTDRGDIFNGSALTMVLVAVTLLVLVVLSRLSRQGAR